MSNQIPVLYTEQKTKKVKIWLDGYLVPRPTLNSARLISAGKHEIDVVFYSSIDDIKPGREFETDRYLITVEESNNAEQSCPRPSFAVNDPTMKNRPKSAGFVPPRLVPKSEPPPPPAPPITSIERHNPNQWGYAGMTTAMKRSTYDDYNQESYASHANKIPKSSHFIPPTFQKHQPILSEEPLRSLPSVRSTPHIPQQQPGLLNDALISQLLNNVQSSPPTVISDDNLPNKQRAPQISWSNWDNKNSDDEDTTLSSPVHDENLPKQSNPINQTLNWHTLIKQAIPIDSTDQSKKNSEQMPKFDFDGNSFDTLFNNLDE